jgi:hypothetical protein
MLLQSTTRLLPGRIVEVQLRVGGWRWSGSGEVVRCQVAAIAPEGEVRYRAAVHFTHPLDPAVHECLDSGLQQVLDDEYAGYGIPIAGSADPSEWAVATRGQSREVPIVRKSQSPTVGRRA